MRCDDWICVYDICAGNCYPFPANLYADWSPSQKLLRFGGNWSDIPDVPMDHEPSEDEVSDIADASEGWHPRMMRAKAKRDAEWNQYAKRLDQHYQKYGHNHIEIVLEWPGGEKRFHQTCGILSWKDCLMAARAWMVGLPAGTKITRFKFTPTRVQFSYP